jgi:phosphatidylglycerol lysyltransferase
MAGLVAISGALLIFIGALPASGGLMTIWGSYSLAAASQFAASVLGSALLVLAYGLARRLAIGWALAVALLLLGGLTVWLRGEAWFAWVPFPAVAMLLLTMRPRFYRRSRLWAEPLSPEALVPLAAAAFCGITLALVGHRVEVQDNSWWEVVFANEAPNALRFTVGLTAVLLLIGLARLLRPARIRPLAYDETSRAMLATWRGATPPAADGVLLGEARRAGMAFSRQPPLWLAYGDPAGDPADGVSAIWRFRDACERAGARPAFWDVGPEWLRIYADIGLTAVPMPGRPDRFIACRAEQDLDRLLAKA